MEQPLGTCLNALDDEIESERRCDELGNSFVTGCSYVF